jgi:cytochrome c-type biogenesis protein
LAVDVFLVAFAFAAGVATFFSPCSVGLFPAYIGYFLGTDDRRYQGVGQPILGKTPTNTDRVLRRTLRGVQMGLLASVGFFLLFLGMGGLVSLAGTELIGPYLKWISIGIGGTIIALGLLQLAGRNLSVPFFVAAPTKRGPFSIFAFGTGYALASLGCTLPIFISVLLASLTVAGITGTLLTLGAYAAGMALVMVVVTAALALTEGAAVAYVRRIVPHVKRASSLLMVLAGGIVIYFYGVVWR